MSTCGRCGSPVCPDCGAHLGAVGGGRVTPGFTKETMADAIERSKRWMPPAAWLKHRVAVSAIFGPEPAPKDAPVYTTGVSRSEREAFKARLLPGDQVWFFTSPPESWRALAGTQGYAILRKGQIVDKLITTLN